MADDWRRGANQYGRTPKPENGATAVSNSVSPTPSDEQERNRDRALYRLRANWDSLTWSAAMLEGNPYTLPEVQTLIDGFTVGGHTRQDTDQVLDILEAYEELTRLLEEGEFIPSVQVSNALNGLVTRHELIKPGMLRGADGWPGTVHVNLAGAGNYEAPDSGDSGERLQAIHQRIVDECAAMDDARLASAHYFCQAVLAQFYRDGNKRTSRMVANGMLVDAGWDAIFIPAKERLHYNELLIDLFTTGDETGLTNLFLALGNQIPG